MVPTPPHPCSHKSSVSYEQDPSCGPSYILASIIDTCEVLSLYHIASSSWLASVSCIALCSFHQLVQYSADLLSHCSISFQAPPVQYGISLPLLKDELSDFLPGLVGSADAGALRITHQNIILGGHPPGQGELGRVRSTVLQCVHIDFPTMCVP